MAGWLSAYFLGHMRPNLPIISLIATYRVKVLGSLIKLEMKDCSSYLVIANFGLGTGFFDGGGGN